MSRIIVVEQDPVVWLDLCELLTARYGPDGFERKPLDEVLDHLPQVAGPQVTLILSDLPRPLDPVKQALGQGVRLIVTNSVAGDDKDALAGATIVGRPFDTSALLDALM